MTNRAFRSVNRLKKSLLWLIAVFLVGLARLAEAQQLTKIPKVGAFIPASESETAHLISSFRQGLREHGYVEKQNLTLE
jgi:hypothetical protein